MSIDKNIKRKYVDQGRVAQSHRKLCDDRIVVTAQTWCFSKQSHASAIIANQQTFASTLDHSQVQLRRRNERVKAKIQYEKIFTSTAWT